MLNLYGFWGQATSVVRTEALPTVKRLMWIPKVD